MQYWLIKSEPEAYSWDNLAKDLIGRWDGVRNYAARNNLKAMQIGDLCLFYHSVTGKEIVGVAKVVKEHYPDPTAEEGDWVCVEVAPEMKLKKPISLAQIKAEPRLAEMKLLKLSRLSVSPVTREEYDLILALSED
ncbi:MAG: EVE domain-containing protein [Microscillaceae bacterium]|jgi:predicted RNA-binding protein with PUA-like domain|nr:EVE domain-containing protein [Microscillaceae bacterium]